MAAARKSELYQALKAQGVQFDKHYRDYSTQELEELWEQQLGTPAPSPEPKTSQVPVAPREDEDELREQLRELTATVSALAKVVLSQSGGQTTRVMEAPKEEAAAAQASEKQQPAEEQKTEEKPKVTVGGLDPNEHAGLTQNSHVDDQAIEVDEHGNIWYQKEVVKPAYPKPRGRRVLRYMDTGVKEDQIRVGEYVETFEVAGDRAAKPAEIKVTLPSYQAGIYRPPNMPFKVHIYRGARGFDMTDVENFYGGSHFVPKTIKRCYVANDLCYDIPTTIATIQDEYRERVLKTERLMTR